jgi:hypothetical protein
VGFFVLAWLWFVVSVVSWVSNQKPPLNLEGESGGLRRRWRENSGTANIGELPSNQNHQQFQLYSENAPACDNVNAEDIDFTLVTQLSNDRLWMMKHHCDRWKSQISLAILTNRTYDNIEQELVDLGCNTSALSLQVLSSKLYPADDYPVNVLRNMALSRVNTSHVMYADIDFWESQDLNVMLHLPQVTNHLAKSHKHALVVPAFQLNRQCREWRECPEDNIPKMPRTRSEMLSLIKKKQAWPFDPTNRGGHGSTLYSTWVTKQTTPGSLIPIPCVNSNRYEPYLAFRYCRDLPPFQEAFSGYGKNKMTMMMHMLRSGYRLHQLGIGFLVHYPHLDSKSRMEWNEAPEAVRPKKIDGQWHKDKPEAVQGVNWTAYKRGRVDATFVEFRNWLAREVPDEAVIHKCDNAEDDDAKLWYDRSKQ